METDASFQAHTDEFIEWLVRQPGTSISPKIQLVDLREHRQGRGVVAIQDIKDGEELFTLPYQSTLTVEKSAFYTKAQDALVDLEYWKVLVLVLVFEYGQQSHSSWGPYLRLLPDNFDTLMYWSEMELMELRGSTILSKIGKVDAEHVFETQLWPIASTYRSDFGEYAESLGGVEGKAIFQTLCHRMASIIFAYGFDLDPDFDSDTEQEVSDEGENSEKLMLVPLADMLNADADFNNAHLIQNQSTVTMTAIKHIPAGSQIFNDFGELPRSDLLRRYGYITDRYKKYDVVELPLTLIIETLLETENIQLRDKREFNTRIEDARARHSVEDGYDLKAPDGLSKLPSLSLQLARLLSYMQRDLKAFQQIDGLTSDDIELRSFHDITSSAPILEAIIRKRLKEYPTTIAQDQAILKGAMLIPRKVMAVEVRLGEKEILAVWLQGIDVVTNDHSGQGLDNGQQTKRKKV